MYNDEKFKIRINFTIDLQKIAMALCVGLISASVMVLMICLS